VTILSAELPLCARRGQCNDVAVDEAIGAASTPAAEGMTSSERLVKMLGQRAPLEWYRFAGGTDAEGTSIPPLIVWRYKEPAPEIEERVRTVVSAFSGQVEWVLDWHDRERLGGRNWFLVPRKVLDVQHERSLTTDTAAMRTLMNEDQHFCTAAVSDLECLVEDLGAALG